MDRQMGLKQRHDRTPELTRYCVATLTGDGYLPVNTGEDLWHTSVGPKRHAYRRGKGARLPPTSAVIDAAELAQLVSTLIGRGYRVVGPTQSDDAIVLAELSSADDLPGDGGRRRPRALSAAPPRRPRNVRPS